MITIKHQCGECGGTGLYQGMGESEHAAVVCYRCNGQGWRETIFQEFTGRKSRPDVRRVYKANPGIKIGEGNGHKLEHFGGMPAADWLEGKPFPAGSEMRRFCCPCWWAQCAGEPELEWPECADSLGREFSRCTFFGAKAACWCKWDAEREATPAHG